MAILFFKRLLSCKSKSFISHSTYHCFNPHVIFSLNRLLQLTQLTYFIEHWNSLWKDIRLTATAWGEDPSIWRTSNAQTILTSVQIMVQIWWKFWKATRFVRLKTNNLNIINRILTVVTIKLHFSTDVTIFFSLLIFHDLNKQDIKMLF